jgi:anti-sigma regulatory factor (Ser/Thr protein kinase)
MITACAACGCKPSIEAPGSSWFFRPIEQNPGRPLGGGRSMMAGPCRPNARMAVNGSTMAGLQKSFFIKARDFIHAGEASIQVQNILKSLQLEPKFIRRVAVCSYEGEMNVVMHGADGTLSIDIGPDGLVLEVADPGPGIANVEQAMQMGFSTASDELREMGFGAGMGLPNMKKNSDHITVDSAPGQGARVRMTFHFREGREGR